MIMDISFNNFINNKALHEGGAMKWNDEKPVFVNNTFENNSAIYGENIASFPIRMIFNFFNKSNFSRTTYLPPNRNEILWNNTHSNISLSNISSGNSIPYVLEFIVLDVYGKIVNLDEGFMNNIIINMIFNFY